MMRSRPTHTRALLAAAALLTTVALSAQRTFHWTGGDGDWNDAAHWSAAAGGAGGAGVPGAKDDAVISAPGPMELLIHGQVVCHDLRIEGGRGRLTIAGDASASITIGGGWVMTGDVQWDLRGRVVLRAEGSAIIDPRAVVISSDVVLDGEGEWDLMSAIHLAEAGSFIVRKGTLRTHGRTMVVGALRAEGRGRRSIDMAGSTVIAREYDAAGLRNVITATSPGLMVNGSATSWTGSAIPFDDFARMMTTCGTGPGQTAFTVTASCTTNYNGFCVSCNGVCDGGVTVNISGGVGPFNIQWSTGPSTANWSPVCDGVKQVLVTDLGQSAPCFASVLVTEPPPVDVFIFSSNLPTCATVCNGTAVTFPGGGVGFGYVYDWNSGTESSPNPSQLCAGPNTLHLIDANNCVRDTVINLPLLPLDVTLTTANASCFGVCDGTADVGVNGGVPPYTYDWSPDPISGDGTDGVSGLCAGNYTLLLTDANGCDTLLLFAITEPLPITPAPASTNETCAGACDGTAGVTPTGPAGPFNYEWAPGAPAGDGTPNVTGLCAGTYTVQITDIPTGCDTTITITIGGPPAIDALLDITDVSCNGDCDGTAILTVSGGTPGYTITWSPPGTDPAQLCAGTYSVSVTDAAGCDTLIDFTISEPAPIVPNGSQTDVTCAGACDGTATVVGATGGTGTLDFAWTPAPPAGQNTPTAGGLCAGDWCVTITDDNGCDTTVCFTIVEPPPLQAAPTQTNVTCGGQCDGTASVLVTGGTPPYAFDWSPDPIPGEGTDSAFALCPGAYSVLITDANGCTLSVPFTILDAVPLQVALTPVDATCPDLCDGSAQAVVSGGQAPYAYDWEPGAPTGDGTAGVTGLCAGSYSLIVTDALGCDTTLTFSIAAPPAILPNETVTNATCAGDCNGSIVLAPTGGNGSYAYSWTPPPPNGPAGSSALDLCPGDWTCTITSGSCDTTITWTITAPPPLQVQGTSTPPACPGTCDGTASILAVSGGTPGYGFDWGPGAPAGDGTQDVTGLCPGTWTCTITDAAGCDTTVTFDLAAPTPIDPQLTTTQPGCGSACDGTASVASGFTSYDWGPGTPAGDGTPNVTGLCSGIYTVTITNAAGCDTTVQFTLSAPSGITLTSNVIDASCPDACDGAIEVSLLDFSDPPYSLNWEPGTPSGEGTGIAFNLCPGPWSVQITNGSGCDTIVLFDLGAPTPIIPNAIFTDETCNGPCDGTAAFSVTGGTPGYTYFWTPIPPEGQGVDASTQLCAGNYTVLITDAGGCDTLVSFTILPVQPIDALVNSSGVTCSGDCDGTAIATANGGTAPYTFTWTPAPPIGQGNDTITGLCAGSYSVLIADVNGCDTTIAFTITTPAPVIAAVTTTAESCSGPCTGTATASASGGTGPYAYAWDPPPGGGQNTPNATGLCSGVNYALTVTDSLGCDTTIAFVIAPFDPIVANISSIPASCNGSSDGVASTGPTGGTPPYTYDWTPDPPGGDLNPQATGLYAGIWSVTITDSAGCDTTVSVLITEPDPIVDNAVAVGATCNGSCDANITVVPSGGTPPYAYAWSPIPLNGDGNPAAFGLCPGIVTLTITDNNGCVAVFTYDLPDPPAILISADVTQSECQLCDGAVTLHASGGYGNFTFIWGPPLFITTTDSVQTNLCAGVYTVNIQDGGSCEVPYTVVITDSNGEPLTTTDGSVQCPTDCNGSVSVSYSCADPPCTLTWFDGAGIDMGISDPVLTNLCPGDYYAQVTNASGCISIDTATVVAPPPIVANISSTPASCPGACDGTATSGPTGGVAPYTFNWGPDPVNGDGTSQVTGLCAGTYTLTITDAVGCSAGASVLILEPQPISVTAALTDPICAGDCNGSIALTVAGGTGVYTYDWSPGSPAGDGTATVTGLCAGTYQVLITDANGCPASFTYTLTAPSAITIDPVVTQSQCTLCNGAITCSVGGGTPGYVITWTDAGGIVVGSGTSVSGLCAGIYTITVIDNAGCLASLVIPITDSDGEALTITDGFTTCANDCDGSVDVSFNCGVPACTIQWTDALGTVIGSANTITDLCAGDYYVLVTNGDGCVSIDTATVSPSQLLLPTITSIPASCNGVCDGVASTGIAGGVPPYTYDWTPDPSGGDGNDQATGLCAGVYTVTIQDFTGCDTTISVLITEPPALAANAVVADAGCAGGCNGSIVATVSGGSPPYTYDWTPDPPGGDGGNGAFGLCAGDWTLVATDNNGCTASFTWTVGEPQPIVLNLLTIASECGNCIGEASVQASGGTTPYTYTWVNAGGTLIGTDSAVTGLCSGFYTATVTDANGCSMQMAVPIGDSNGEVLNTNDGATTCVGSCDGVVSVDFICADPACSITWYDGVGTDINESGNSVDSLCAGTYFVFVANGSGCLSIDTALVIPPSPITALISTQAPLCAGDCNGTATVGVSGGTGATFSFDWSPDPINGDGTAQVTDLCAGIYSVTITDSLGCDTAASVAIIEPLPIGVSAAITDVACNGDCNGAITITITGGTGLYVIDWSPDPITGDGTSAITDLCAGDYTVTITDANGCTVSFTYTISEPPALQAGLLTTDNPCFGDCIGTATTAITGGVPPYAIAWLDAGGTTIALDSLSINGLCAGDYTLHVVDANSCVSDVPFTIGQGNAINAGLVFSGETCNGPCDGTAQITPGGGAGGFTITWLDPLGNTYTIDTTGVSGLCAGNWSVVIADANGCDTTVAFTIPPYAPVSAGPQVNDVQCSGASDGSIVLNAVGTGPLSYDWTPDPPGGDGNDSATGLYPGPWSVTITDGVGCDSTLSFTIAEPAPLQITVDTVTDASCATATDGAIAVSISGGTGTPDIDWSGPGGFSSTAEDITDLAAGLYTVTVTDANGCTATTSVSVNALISVIADAGAGFDECIGTSITLDGSATSGATSYVWTDSGGNTVGTSAVVTLTGLAAGPYTFTLTASDGPCSDQDQVTVIVHALPNAEAGNGTTIFLGNSVTLGGTPTGPPGSAYSWQPDSLLMDASAPNPVTEPLFASQWFVVTVTDTTYGCSSIDSVFIEVVPDVLIPSGFSPNGDGWNDTWVIDLIELFPDVQVEIYNRWGQLLFESVGYADPWDGTYNGGLVPIGTYYYVVNLNDPKFPEPYTGPLTILR